MYALAGASIHVHAVEFARQGLGEIVQHKAALIDWEVAMLRLVFELARVLSWARVIRGIGCVSYGLEAKVQEASEGDAARDGEDGEADPHENVVAGFFSHLLVSLG